VTDCQRKLEHRRPNRDPEAQGYLLKSARETGRLAHFRLINLRNADRIDAGELQ